MFGRMEYASRRAEVHREPDGYCVRLYDKDSFVREIDLKNKFLFNAEDVAENWVIGYDVCF